MQTTHDKFAPTSTDTNVLQAVHILKNASRQPLDKPNKAMMPHSQTITPSPSTPAFGGARNSVDRRIRAFLNGESHGEDVLGALYGGIADEAIPERLRRLVKG